jgi:hypothetical protein
MVKGDIMRAIDGCITSRPITRGTDVRYDLSIELVVPLPGFVKRRRGAHPQHDPRVEEPSRSVTLAAGIDVGGTKVFGLSSTRPGNVVREHRVATPHGGTELIEAMASVAEALAPYDSLGVGVPGLVSREQCCGRRRTSSASSIWRSPSDSAPGWPEVANDAT